MNRRGQLHWMILLAAAVILPTVSLLWFMSRVVANERLVIRQKLETLYQQKLNEAGDRVKQRIDARFAAFSQTDWTLNPYGLLHRLVFDEHFQGMVLWNADGARVYPSTDRTSDAANTSIDAGLAQAWQLEFIDHDYEAACGQYGRLTDSNDPRALAGQVRCLVRLGRLEEAMKAAMEPQQPFAASVRLLLLNLLEQDEAEQDGRKAMMNRLAAAVAQDLFRQGTEYLPAAQNLMVARRLLDYEERTGNADLEEPLQRLADAETHSLAAAEVYPMPTGPVDTIVSASIDGWPGYLIRHSTQYGDILVLMSSDGLASALDGYRDEFGNSDAQFRILDAQGRLIAGQPGKGMPPIASASLPRGFPEGHVELYFSDGDVFSRAADRQITIYIWTGVLVILLLIAVGAFAVQAVGRQIRLNRMKNDFIATVSHELKTPLASMRLLVDTLLEGRTRDEAHAGEYLRMIARENERLTRMIENFLSFSRMERNKNAFTIAPASPVEIVEDAVDSVCTKYRANQCRLETELADGLPEIPADHDAIVTVLINLLDNACKYTADDKQIRLSLFREDDEVCFAVADNGIGMSRRQVRRIFDSFYQVDDSLSRAAQGCGLGLSIVHFIVNAHKGRIEVDSEPGKGSTFTVRLPI